MNEIMGFMMFLIGVGGVAGAIDLDRSPVLAIGITIIGLFLHGIECKIEDMESENDGDYNE